MARRQYFRLRVLLVLAVLSLLISLKPVLITARAEKSSGCEIETKVKELNQISHVGRIETDVKRRRTKTRRMMMNVEEINDYPGSGANNRHTPRPYCIGC